MSVKVDVTPAAINGQVHVTVPLVPLDGTLLQSAAGPLFCTIETNVIDGGSGSVREMLVASSGPLFVTEML
jgi:hypothetical protein